MPTKNPLIEKAKLTIVGLMLTGFVTLGTWIVSSIQAQNVHLAELIVEVKSLNERLGQYATKDELHELQRKLDIHIAVTEARRN